MRGDVLKNKVFSRAALCLSALFVLGDAIIMLPTKDGANYTFFGFLAAAVAGIALYFLISLIYNKIPTDGNFIVKTIESVFLVIVAVFSVFAAANTFSVFTRFASEVILKNIPIPIINSVFLIVVVYFAFKRQEAVLKFSLICFVLIFILIIFFLLASLGDYRLENLAFEESFDWEVFYKSVKSFIPNPVIPALILPFYYRFALNERHISAHLGVIVGYLLLGLAVISSLLLFGTELSAVLSFPHFSAVSTITVGRLYTRLDGFLYFVYFVTSIIKINVCIFICYSCLKRLSNN